MARRRVFETSVECPGITNLGITANQHAILGRTVTFEKATSSAKVGVHLEGAVVGYLDDTVGPQVAAAIDRGQLFKATIKKAYQNYDKRFQPTCGLLSLKVEYLLEVGQQPITIIKASVHTTSALRSSFFTKVAGVTFEGRQRIIARCSIGERLLLVRERDNQFDPGAIRVLRLNGEFLGYIPAHVSRDSDSSGLAFRLDRGDQYKCRISDLTGGDGLTRGVNIEITDGDEFDTPAGSVSLVEPPPVYGNIGWLIAIVVALILGIAIIYIDLTRT